MVGGGSEANRSGKAAVRGAGRGGAWSGAKSRSLCKFIRKRRDGAEGALGSPHTNGPELGGITIV